MSTEEGTSPNPPASPERDQIVVLLIDDQAIVGHAVKEMLRPEADIKLHFCQDPTQAIALANTLSPSVILQDLVMPEIDGLTLLKFFRGNKATRETPMIVLSSKEEPATKAKAFALGASDYLVKLPDRIELIARIRHHARGYIAQIQRNEAYRRLAESERRLAEEVAQAAEYVRSLLPRPLLQGPVTIEWRFVPSTQLAGDAFGYRWLDETHLAIYLLDVSGHGVGSALLAVSVLNVLESGNLANTDFHDPAAVMPGLNAAFQMERHGGKYFTIWYGVLNVETGRLVFGGGGHPPTLLLNAAASGTPALRELEPDGPAIGITDQVPFANSVVDLNDGSTLLLYSDGAVEIDLPGDVIGGQDDFSLFVAGLDPGPAVMEQILARARSLREVLNDDCSIMHVTFQPSRSGLR